MSKRQDVKNSTSRIWTKAEMKVTLTQAKANGFTVTKEDLTVEVVNPANNDLILKSVIMNDRHLVRIDRSYFGK